MTILRDAASQSDAVAVAYSGGKDSIVVLDLCARTFQRVECFFMYLVPGLECVEAQLDLARSRFGVSIRQYPHWLVADLLRRGVYCPNTYKQDDLPDYKLRDIYTLARTDARAPVVATGAKRADSLWRRRSLPTTSGWTDLVYPIVGWNKFDVLSYLGRKKLPVPPSSGSATGIDLSTPALLWLHDTFPRDFEKLCETFPYAESVVWRRKFYGVA